AVRKSCASLWRIRPSSPRPRGPRAEEISMKALIKGVLTVATIGIVGGAAGAALGAAARAAAGEPADAAAEQFPGRSNRGAFRSVSPYENHNFYFTRAMYAGGGRFRGSGWAVDYPEADLWIINVLNRLTGVDVSPYDNVVQLDDP